MKQVFSLALATALLLNACSSNEPAHDSTLETGTTTLDGRSTSDSSAARVADTLARAADSTGLVQNLGMPPVNTVTPNLVTPGATAMTTTATAPGMNPAHGQPGHRCDINVGAPLNSAPAKPATTTATAVTPTTTQITPPTAKPGVTAAKTVTAPGMNPPHGEPGHRCDISVGAPLNSAPTKPATTTTVSPVQSSPLPITPGQLTPVQAPAKKDSGQ